MTKEKNVIKVSAKLYDKEAVTATLYKFTNKCYVKLDMAFDGDFDVTLKKKMESIDLDKIINKFNNELIDQQTRIDTNNKFGKIREALVKKAFSPISE